MYKESESIIVTMAFEYAFPTQITTTTNKKTFFGYFSKNQNSDMFQTIHAVNIIINARAHTPECETGGIKTREWRAVENVSAFLPGEFGPNKR